jgi:uncharacterized membrane protein YsdA (DUF1294 family)
MRKAKDSLLDELPKSPLLSYPFQGARWEEQWTLLVPLLAVLLVIMPPLAVVISMGVASQVARAVLVEGRYPAMPDHLPWRAVLRDGLRWWLVSIFFQTPAFLTLLVFGAYFLNRYGVPADVQQWTGIREGWLLLLAGLGGILLLSILGGWLSNIAQMHLSRHDSLAAAFRFGEWGRLLRANLSGFLGGLLRVLALGFSLGIAQFVASVPAALLIVLPPLIGAFFSLYMRLIATAIYAEAYRAARENRV